MQVTLASSNYLHVSLDVAEIETSTPLGPENSLFEILYFCTYDEKGKEHVTEAQTFLSYQCGKCGLVIMCWFFTGMETNSYLCINVITFHFCFQPVLVKTCQRLDTPHYGRFPPQKSKGSFNKRRFTRNVCLENLMKMEQKNKI